MDVAATSQPVKTRAQGEAFMLWPFIKQECREVAPSAWWMTRSRTARWQWPSYHSAASRNAMPRCAACDSAVDGSSENSRWTLQALRNGLREKVPRIMRGKAHDVRRHRRHDGRWQGHAMVGRGVFCRMLVRCSGIDVALRRVLIFLAILVVACAGKLIQLLCDCTCACCGIPATLHRKAMQGQQHHQEKAKISTHRNGFSQDWRGL